MFSSFLTINMYHQNTDFYILETNPHNANARTYWKTKKRRMMRETQNGIKEWAQRRQKSSQKWGYESTRFCSIRTAPRHSLRLQACQTPHTWQRSANFGCRHVRHHTLDRDQQISKKKQKTKNSCIGLQRRSQNWFTEWWSRVCSCTHHVVALRRRCRRDASPGGPQQGQWMRFFAPFQYWSPC